MMSNLSIDEIDNVVGHAHRKAASLLMGYMEEMLSSELSDDKALYIYRQEFLRAIFNAVDGNDETMKVSCHVDDQPLAGLATALERKGYAEEVHSLSPLRLEVQIRGVNFTFENTHDGRILTVGNDFHAHLQKWTTALVDLLEVMASCIQQDMLRPYYEKVLLSYHIENTAREIMRETVYGIIASRMQGEEYDIILSCVTEDEVVVLLDTVWGSMRITSSFRNFDEAFNTTLGEIKQFNGRNCL